MQYQFLKVDISACTFTGLSLNYQRKVAFFATGAIFVGLLYFGYQLAICLSGIPAADEYGLLLLSAILIHYILTGEMILQTLSRRLLECTPIAVLYRQDKKIVDKAKSELYEISNKIEFIRYLDYGKVNPAIRSKKLLLVIAHQRKGDLQEWTKNVRNLKLLADLVYQIYLVERLLSVDGTVQ